MGGVQLLDEFGVDPLGEMRMPFKGRADGGKVKRVDLLHRHHAVGVAHADAGDGPVPAGGCQGHPHKGPLPHAGGGQGGGHRAVAPHLDLPEPLPLPAQGLDAAQSVDPQPVAGDEGRVVATQPLGHAADAVAAHPALAAVGVVDAHHRIRPRRLGRADADDPVRPD